MKFLNSTATLKCYDSNNFFELHFCASNNPLFLNAIIKEYEHLFHLIFCGIHCQVKITEHCFCIAKIVQIFSFGVQMLSFQ